MNYVRKLLEDAQRAGFRIAVICDGEIDYRGHNATEALKAVDAVCEATVRLRDPATNKQTGCAFIVNGLAEDERIADYSGEWINTWWEKNLG